MLRQQIWEKSGWIIVVLTVHLEIRQLRLYKCCKKICESVQYISFHC